MATTSETAVPASAAAGGSDSKELHRSLDWRGAFWVAAGVPPLVLFSIGGIAGVAGKLAFVVWIVSMIMGFLQSFTYAEIAGLFANKSGGASIYGATAWLRYSKLIAPLSVWCNWFAWSPVLSLGCVIAASYILNAFAHIPTADSKVVVDWVAAHAGSITVADPRVTEWLGAAVNAGKTAQDAVSALLTQDAISALTPAIRTWSAVHFEIPHIASFNINATFVIGAALMLIIFGIQDRGILGTAKAQRVLAIIVLVPLLLIGILPLLNGSVNYANFSDLVPPSNVYVTTPGSFNNAGWTLILAGMFIAAWSTYGFETAVCYTRELRNPAVDTFKAIFFSGLLCMLFYFLVPFTFQGVLGLDGMLATPIVDGSGIGEALGNMVGGGSIVTQFFVILMILALVLAIMTAMAGSSRTLYQGSKDGWLPRYLTHVNKHGAPTRAMWTDLTFNLILLAIASDAGGYYFVLAVSNVGYIIFNFLNLNAGWIHRMDSGHIVRPWKAPTWIIVAGVVFAFANLVFMGAGAKVWQVVGARADLINPLWAGLMFAALVIPVFLFRHYVQDKGRFPPDALTEIGLSGEDLGPRKAGVLPYVTLAAGVVVVLVCNYVFKLPA
jgi:amino acid transporter